LQKVSCWVLDTGALANQLNELQPIWKTTIKKLLFIQMNVFFYMGNCIDVATKLVCSLFSVV
jgi:hypothetical protein